jgi:hypothetical protein
MRPWKLLAGLPAVLAIIAASAAWGGAGDYDFQPLKAAVKNGPSSEIAIRLVHKPTGKPVTGAVIFRTRLDMSPDGMEPMTAKHEALSETEPGIYRFRADFTMEGHWALKLMAKVQGEAETVTGTVVFNTKN